MSEIEKDDGLENELKDFSFVKSAKRFNMPPVGYFEQLPDRIINRWEKEKAAPYSRAIPMWRMIASAAIVSGICFGIVWWTNQANKDTADPEISSAEAYQYIMEHIEDFAPLILQHEQWAEGNTFEIQEPTAIEEYLIEELEGEDPETIF